ncbi:cation:proton antiporter [Gordonia sp. OPL2]|uniref:cation:proton antiporter n=1 Tax=Gordonia sp. OPL2 TaxID=2486274 RepID=UPI001654EC8E|nr:cation:proton antiporter [Gordonia sp. OPL2]RPA20068.1 cation:proton antiporter [Gordonia sp. OPL2]
MLTQLAIILGAAVVLGMIARRLGLPAMVGELLAGVVLGPSLLGWLLPAAHDRLFPDDGPSALVAGIGQFGVLLLVGLAAAELDFTVLRRRGKVIASVSVWSFAIPLAFGIGVGFGVPDRFHGSDSTAVEFALLLGTAMSVSAIPVIAKILTDLDLLRKEIGQVILSAGTLSDVGAWMLLAVVSAMTTVGLRGWQVPLTAAYLGAAIAVTWLLRPWVRKALDRVETSSNAVYVNGIVVVLIVAGAAATDALHLEAALGAFLAGLMVGRRGHGVLGPLQTVTAAVLAPVFLATAGLHLDLAELGRPGVAVLAVVVLVVAVAGKLIGGYLGARLVGVSRWESLALGSGLNARGVVEIILATIGLQIGVFSESVYAIVVLLALATSIMAGPMLVFATRRFESESIPAVRPASVGADAGVDAGVGRG